MIYLDHAATSWPKPPAVAEAMVAALRECGNPGRGGHALAMRAAEAIFDAREAVATLFGIADPLRVCFTAGATQALNLAIKGMLQPGDHAVCSAMEHNAVWRPLKKCEAHGIGLSVTSAGPDGIVTPEAVAAALRPETRLISITHASNVNGALNDIAAIGRLAHSRGIAFLVDAAQTAGAVPIDVDAMNIDLLAFPGHKGLLGPPGVGGLYLRPGIVLETQSEGGTGSDSANPRMPDVLPERFEPGTPNLPGICGLKAGIDELQSLGGIPAIARRAAIRTRRLTEGLSRIDGVSLYGPAEPAQRVGVVSFTLKGWDTEAAAACLGRKYAIACRAGLHCAALAHRSQGTTETGTIRFSPGPDTTEAEIDTAVAAVCELAAHRSLRYKSLYGR